MVLTVVALMVVGSAQVMAAPTPPPSVGNPTATLNGREMVVSWTANRADEWVTGFEIKIRDRSEPFGTFVKISTTDSARSYRHTVTNPVSIPLREGKDYVYWVRAFRTTDNETAFSTATPMLEVSTPDVWPPEPGPRDEPTPEPEPENIDGSAIPLPGVYIAERTDEYTRFDWPQPQERRILGVYAERWRVGDPETHLYRIYDLFNSRETGFTDRHVELGEEYQYYIYPRVVNDLEVPRYSRDDSELGIPAPLFRLMPPKPPFVPPPPNFRAERYRFYAANLTWDRVDDDTPAFIVHWRKSDQEYQTTGSESEGRIVINSQEDYTRRVWQDEGFYETRVGPAKKHLQVTGLVRNTTYYFRVGTCAAVSRTTDDMDSCVMADVHWAPERSVYTYWPY